MATALLEQKMSTTIASGLPNFFAAVLATTPLPVSLASNVLPIFGIETLEPYGMIFGSTAIVRPQTGFAPVEVIESPQ